MTILSETEYWAVLLSAGTYIFAYSLQKKIKNILLNPLLLSTVITVLFLV